MPLKLLNDWRSSTPRLLRIEQIAFNSTQMAEILKKDNQLFFNRVRTQSPCASRDLAPLSLCSTIYGSTRCTRPITVHEKTAICKSQ